MPPLLSKLSPAGRAVGLLTAVFALVVTALKLLQHYSLQTQAYDLGILANTVWNTAHGRWFYTSLIGGSYFTDHFSPVLLFLAPLFWLWENAAVLLVFQTAVLALALPAVYLLARQVTGKPVAAVLFAAWLAVFPYLHHVSRYDFHEVALAVPLFLWALYFWETKREKKFWAVVAAAFLVREDIPLMAAGLGVYAALSWKERPGWGAKGAALAAAGILLCAVEVTVVIPRFGSSWRSAAFSYGNLGSNWAEMAAAVLTPTVLWRNSLGDPEKLAGLLKLFLLAGGLPFLAPRAWALLVIPLGVNLLSANPAQYRFEGQYSAVLLPFLFFAMIHGYRRLDQWAEKTRPGAARWLPAGLCALMVAGMFAWPRYFRPIGWTRMKDAQAVFARVPEDGAVRAQNNLFPHVCLRRDVGLLEAERPARWVLLDTKLEGWRPPESARQALSRFAEANRDKLVAQQGGLLLFDLGEGI